MKSDQHVDHMKLGKIAQQQGRFREASSYYDIAFSATSDKAESARALHERGISERLNRCFAASTKSLELALKLARELDDSNELQVRITRDLAMTQLESLKPGEYTKLEIILNLLDDPLTYFSEDDPEHWATVGYIGRAWLLYGETRKAVSIMIDADKHLSQSPVKYRDYELNNLMWLMVAAGRRRKQYRRRALRLIYQTNQTRRYRQLSLTMIGGERLFRLARRLRS